MPAPPAVHSAARARRPSAALKLAGALANGSLRAGETLLLWLERIRQRRALGSLNDHMLKDLGISRSDAGRETGKRFWEG
jgi:uncharacterized protein YjiS (DUF1127 family)